MALMAEAEAWWGLRPFLDDEDAVPVPPTSRGKFEQMVNGTDAAYELAIKHGVNLPGVNRQAPQSRRPAIVQGSCSGVLPC